MRGATETGNVSHPRRYRRKLAYFRRALQRTSRIGVTGIGRVSSIWECDCDAWGYPSHPCRQPGAPVEGQNPPPSFQSVTRVDLTIGHSSGIYCWTQSFDVGAVHENAWPAAAGRFPVSWRGARPDDQVAYRQDRCSARAGDLRRGTNEQDPVLVGRGSEAPNGST